jgi:hypothetical protein
MKTHNLDILKSKQTSAVLGLLILVAIVAIAPHAFAQQQGIPLGGPYGTPQPSPDQGMVLGVTVGLATAAAVSGIGIWTAVRKR